MVDALVILDGASEPLQPGSPTSLERARTPALDALAAAGDVIRIDTVPAGLAPGSENCIPGLLGWTPPAAVDRGAVEAAARGIAIPAGARAWRIDAARGAPASAAALAALLPDHEVHALGRHRLLVVGAPPLPAVPAGLYVWPEGIVPPPCLDPTTTVVAAPGAVAGLARLMGAAVVTPAGATGRPGTDLGAKARAAVAAIEAGAAHVVVHVGSPDEAAHDRDPDAKVREIERADADLIEPLARVVTGTLQICADHGCDPRTGAHDPEPVPCLFWPGSGTGGRFTECDAALTPVPA